MNLKAVHPPGVLAAGLLLLCLGSSCSKLAKIPQEVRATRAMFGGTLPFEVIITPDANDHSPVAVDLLVLYDDKLLAKLQAIKAADWFLTQRDQFLKDNAAAVASQVWEWTPGQEIAPLSVKYHAGAQAVVLFASYASAGDHRAVLGPQEPFKLLLGAEGFSLERLPWKPL